MSISENSQLTDKIILSNYNYDSYCSHDCAWAWECYLSVARERLHCSIMSAVVPDNIIQLTRPPVDAAVSEMLRKFSPRYLGPLARAADASCL